jgi:hypothetical protein
MVALGVTAVVQSAGRRRARGAPARSVARGRGSSARPPHARSSSISSAELASALAEPVVVAATPHPLLEFTGGTEPGERLAYTIEGTTLVRRATPRFATEPTAGPGVRVLADVAALEVRAFDGRDWLAQWHASTPPEAVRVRIVFADGEAVTTVAAIPIARRRSVS